MKGLELLNALIERCEETIEVAEVQSMNEGYYTRGWAREKRSAEKNLKVLWAIKEGVEQELAEAKVNSAKTTKMELPNAYPGVGASYKRLCWTNYRCILLWNRNTFLIDPIFWTPELGIDNSHYALMRYAERNYRDDENNLIYDIDYRWGGFYTYGLGNGNQEQLTLYGESSDYRHNEYSEAIKECFLKGIQFFPDMPLKDDEELPF